MFGRWFQKRTETKADMEKLIRGEVKVAGFGFTSPLAFQLPVQGDTIVLDGKTLTSGDLVRDEVRQLEKGVTLCRLKSRGFCLRLDEDIPTFDSGDREYDSWHRLCVLPGKDGFTGLYVAGGYRLAEARCYRRIAGKDEAGCALLTALGEAHE